MPQSTRSGFWRKLSDSLLNLVQYFTGEEPAREDHNDAIFREVFPDTDDDGHPEKRVLQRYRGSLSAILSYGLAGNSEQTEVTSLNERGLFVYSTSRPAIGCSIEVEVVLPAELVNYGKRRVRYHATVVRVEEQPSGQRFGIAAAIKRCEVLPEQHTNAMAAKV
jgi:hypothetical protein